MAIFNLPELMHAHPLLTVLVMTALVVGVFFLVLFQADQDKVPQAGDIQRGSGDWQFPPKQKESA